MTTETATCWEKKRTAETVQVEETLRAGGFQQVDAYRYNSASIRVRVIDPKFQGLPPEARDALVEPLLEQLPERTRADIITLFTFAPAELQQTSNGLREHFREHLQNTEFEDPSPSRL